MERLRVIKIEQIPLDEHLIYRGGIGECAKCGVEYERKGFTARYCKECRLSTDRRYSNLEPRERASFYGRDTLFDPTEIFIPEDLRSDKWLSGMFLISKALIFYSIVDIFKSSSHLKNQYLKKRREVYKKEAIQFLFEEVPDWQKEWVENLIFMSRADICRIRRVVFSNMERSAA